MRWVLLPGFDGTGMLYAPFLQALPPEVAPVVLRYPTDRICSANELLGIVLSHLPENEPYILIAESFSGPIALRASALHPKPPVALVLCASFAKCPLPRVVMMMRIFGSVLVRCRPPRWLVRRYLIGKAPEELAALFYSAISAVSPHVLAHRFTVLLEFNEEYASVCSKSPLLYLQAGQDRLVSKRNVCLLQRRYPTAQIERIESPHLMLQARPDAAVRAILSFIARLPATKTR
jgi:sigma-B regulation protein RsbQ